MDLVTAEEMRKLERHVMDEIGLPGSILMENAGRSVAQEIIRRFPKPKAAAVLAGSGNNGGDGWVIARHLLFQGWRISAWLVGSEEKMGPDARLHYEVFKRFGAVHVFGEGQEDSLRSDLENCEVLVDALLGIGAQGALRPPLSRIVQWVNERRKRPNRPWVVAVDLPTGVHSDTGEIASEAIAADLTVTFQCAKWGHYLRPGAEACGELIVAPIGLPPLGGDSPLVPMAKVNHPALWRDQLKPRKEWAHKGTYGHLLLIGGAQGMLGAIKMAGEAAYRSGCGMVTCAVPQSERQALSASVLQELAWGWPGEESFAPDSWEWFAQRKKRFSAVAIGPGLGRFPGEEEWLKQLIRQVEVPLVLDADALNILADHPRCLERNSGSRPIIITPHPGEMARLAQTTVAEVEKQRHRIAKEWAEKTRTIVVLKGRYTIIAFPDGRQVVNPTGGPALAKAGSGDMLTGIIASFLAQRMPVSSAVLMGVYLHGKLGEAVQALAHSATASDLIRSIGAVYEQIHKDFAP